MEGRESSDELLDIGRFDARLLRLCRGVDLDENVESATQLL